MRKGIVLLLIIALAASSLTTVESSFAQVGVTNPAIPAFSVTFQTYTHYIPPTYGVDPSTGKAVMTKEGYTEVEKWVRVEIGGQPFIRYNNSAGQLISLFYNVRWKGNHDTSWQYIPQGIHYQDAAEPWDTQAIGRLISIGFKGIPEGPASGWMELLDPNATQIDFQVEALIGYYDSNDVFVGQSSGWSNTQTITIPANTTSTPADNGNPSDGGTEQTEPRSLLLDLAVVGIIAAAIASVGLFFFMKRRKEVAET